MRKFFSLMMAVLFGVAMYATTYTAAGTPAALFGTTWDPTNTANDLIDNQTTGHNYILNFENVTLPAGEVKFKICEDHAWATAYPASDYTATIAESGVYVIAISFDSESKEVGFRASKTADAEVLPTIALHGNFTGTWNDTEMFAEAGDKATASLKLNLAAGNYEFGVKVNGTWTSNGSAFTRENNSYAIVPGSGNLTLAADVAGEYELVWTYATNTLAITFPEKGDDPIVPPTPVDSMTVYFYNNLGWETVNTFVWPAEGAAYKEWPGEAAQKEAEQINDEDVYAYTFPVSYVNIIFNNGTVQTADLKWDADKPYFVPSGEKNGEGKYTGTWYAKADIPAHEALAKFYITGDSALVVDAGLEAAKAWAPAAIKSTETSYKLNLKAGVAYQLKITVDGDWNTGKGFSDLTTKAKGLTTDNDNNIIFTLATAGEVNVHYDGEFFFLNGDFYVAPVEVKYYLKNNWGGAEDWTWKEMTDLGDGTYMLYNVVVGGEGVNRNTAESDEGASWFAWADIETFDASYEPATIGALDTVVIYFDPEAVNSFTGANGMSAQILGKYVAPVEPEEKLPVVGLGANFNGWNWQENLLVNAEDSLSASIKVNLGVTDSIQFKIVSDGSWLSLNGEGETLYKLHRDWNKAEHVNLVNDGRNFSLETDVAGEYTFTWTYADSTLVVTFPEKPAEPIVGDGPIFEWTKDEGAKIEADNTDLNANNMGTMTVGKSVVARLLSTNPVDNNAKGYKLGNNDVCVEIEGTRAFAAGDTVVITGVCGGSGERAFAVAPVTTIDAKADTVLTNYQESTSDVLEYKAVLKEQQAGDKIRIFRLAGKTMYLYSIKVLPGEAPAEEPAKFYITGDAALVGEELAWNPAAIKSTETSYKLNLAAGDYKLKVTVDGTWSDGMAKGYDALTTIAEGLTADEDGNICFTLTEAGEVNVHYDGEFFFLNGDFYVAPEPETKYYAKNNWDGVTDWTWKEMTMKSDDDYQLECVFGGTGVNINTTESDEGAAWYAAADITAFDASYEPATLGALDTIVLMYTPSEKMLAALIIGKYAEPVTPPTPDVIYSVAGSTALLGAEWNEKEGNEMTLDPEDGLYKLLCADVTLAASTEYKFKIVTNHNWSNPNYPAQDKILTVEKDGKYDVTITFNAETKDVAYVAEFKGGAVIEKHYLIVGDAAIANDEDWNNAAETNLMKSEDEGLTYKLVVNGAKLIANREYGYKVVEQGTWTEYFPKKEGAANEYFSVEESAVYTITYTYTVATSQCAVVTTKTGELPEPTLKDGFYLVGTFDDVAAWTVEDLNASKQFKFIEETETYTAYAIMADLKVGDKFKVVLIQQDVISYWMPDGQDNEYIVNANEAGEGKIIYLIFTNEGYYYYVEPNLYDGYYLVGTMNNWTPSKEYRFSQNPDNADEFVLSTTLAEEDEFKVVYVYNGVAQDKAWYPSGENTNYVVDANHAGQKDIYFRSDSQGGEDWYYGCIYVAPNAPTGISNAAVEGKAVKTISNGMLIIEKAGVRYNVMGQIVR